MVGRIARDAMALSPEELAAAQKMHDFVRGVPQQLRAFGGSFLGVIPGAVWMTYEDREHKVFVIVGILVFMVFLSTIWRKSLEKRRQQYQVLLELLEREHGDELPWVVEEKQLADYQALEKEIARHASVSAH